MYELNYSLGLTGKVHWESYNTLAEAEQAAATLIGYDVAVISDAKDATLAVYSYGIRIEQVSE